MRPDTTSRSEEAARDHERIRGRDEWIGGEVGDQEANGLLATTLGPDPWGDVGPVHHPTRFDLPVPAEPPF